MGRSRSRSRSSGGAFRTRRRSLCSPSRARRRPSGRHRSPSSRRRSPSGASRSPATGGRLPAAKSARPPLRKRSWSPSTEVRRAPSVTPPRRRSRTRPRSESQRRSRGGAGVRGGARVDGKISRIPDGLRDKRFHGYMKFIDKKQGFGFIECDETRAIFERDIFVDLTRLPPGVDRPGDPATFVLVVGRRGYPEASSVKVP
mmetsp:Transcript_105195/g.314210  ORF Transcript_105195/g.314210 Transcript_105195/m.314210 type:complete len:201 (+) Transcript_105195:134-736(+)